MNGRRIVWLALFTLGIAAVIAAVSAVADPADINNPPTEDWLFDSGDTVIISYRTWDINYNITVANNTLLAFDECTLTFGDPADLNARWIWVMWNGSMIVNNCTFKSSGSMKYYIEIENTTKFMGSVISGTRHPNSGEGGITAWYADLTFDDVLLKDTPDHHALVTYNCQIYMDNFRVSNAGSLIDGRAAVWLDWRYTNWDEYYMVTIKNSDFSNNIQDGLRVYQWSNYADFTFEITDCTFDSNGQDGIDWYWRYGRNSTFQLNFTDCSFNDNNDRGLYIEGRDHYYDQTGSFNMTVIDCTFEGNNYVGADLYCYYFDGQSAFMFTGCTFKDNGALGGLYMYTYRFYGPSTVDFDDCWFENNGGTGLRVAHSSLMYDGSSFNVVGTTFVDNKDQGVLIFMNSYYEFMADFMFDRCTFTDNGEGGIFIQHQGMLYQRYDLTVTECDFTGGTGGVTSESEDWSYGARDVYWTIDQCNFMDIDGKAILLNLNDVAGNVGLTIDTCQLDNTNGIGLNVLGSIITVQANHELIISKVDILNTPDNGVDAMVIGYYGVGFDVHLTDVVIDKALFNGIKALTSRMFSSAANTIDMDISLTDVDISTISGTGINLGSEIIDYAGTRAINAHRLDIANTQKAMVLSSVKGGFWDTSITGSLKQDVVVITSEVELFRPILDILDPEKVQVIESGSVRFWFSLKVHVNWDTGLPVEGAVVEITDNHHTLIGAFTQFDDTGLPELTLNSYQFSEIGQFTRSPYVLNVTFRAINKLVPVELDFDTVVNIELADHVAPQVFINEPLSDHIQRSTIIDVRGSSFDTESAVDMVEVSIDGVNWIEPTTQTNWASWAHTFTVTEKDVDDNGGIFTIRARATDAAGNDATFLTSMEIDPFPPELRIDFPYDGLQTNTPAIDVRGVTERGATVRVNGVEVVLAGTLFLTQLDLVEGPNTITVATADALGNAMEMKMEVVLDTKPPYLVLLTPEEGELFNEPTCTVSGQAEDDLRIWVNDNLLGDDHYGAGTFEYAVSLTRGENMVTLKSIDLAGNELHLSRIISLDDVLPILAVQAPLDGSHHNSMTIDVFGTTDEDSYLLINSDLVVLDHGLFAYSIVGVEGMNEILIVTSDEAGNVVSETLTVYIDTEGPTMVVTSPEGDHDLVTDEAFTITGVAVGAHDVWVNGVVGPVMEDGTFSIPVTLLEGVNRFIITVADQAGNSVTMNRYVTMDTQAPLVVVSIPNLVEKPDKNIYKTKKGKPSTMTITGFTDEAVKVRINGESVPVSTEGYFIIDHTLTVLEDNSITITAEDVAGNEATWEETVLHKYIGDESDEGFDIGILILVVGLIFLAIALLVGWKRLTAVEERQEIVVEEDEVLAPAMMPEVEEEETMVDEEEEIIVDEEEEIHELTPPGERPRTDASRPVSEPSDEVTIEIDEKDLEEMDADADVDADESEQEEGI